MEDRSGEDVWGLIEKRGFRPEKRRLVFIVQNFLSEGDMRKALIGVIAAAFMTTPAYAEYKRVPGFKAEEKHTDRGMQIAGNLVKLRSELAKKHVNLKKGATEDTARKTCMAVVEDAKKITAENDIFMIRFVSEKFRKPENAPKDERNWDELTRLQIFEKNREKKELWGAAHINDDDYYIYMRPIFAEKRCLVCHGEEKKRPKFIKDNYQGDRSYGFEEGDLMGAVAVYTWKGF